MPNDTEAEEGLVVPGRTASGSGNTNPGISRTQRPSPVASRRASQGIVVLPVEQALPRIQARKRLYAEGDEACAPESVLKNTLSPYIQPRQRRYADDSEYFVPISISSS